MFKKLLRSQTGFSIIQGMMLAAAVAGMAYVGTRLTTDQKLAQKGSESKGRVEQLHAMIYSIMQNKDHCTETFLKAGIVPAVNSCYKAPPMTLTSCTDMVSTPGVVWTKGNPAAVFKVKAASTTYDSTLVYMNNSVTINEVHVTFPASLSSHADMKILYGKIDSADTGARTGKGYGSKTVAKTIKLKIQRDPTTNAFESCYAVDVNENQDMVKDFCEGLGADNNTGTASLFTWDATHQKCVLIDNQCDLGEVFTGFDSNGQKLCYKVKDWMDFGALIDGTANQCNSVNRPRMHFGTIPGNKVQIQCECYNDCGAAGIACFYTVPGCPGTIGQLTTCGGSTQYCTSAGSSSPGCPIACYW